ncbi:MULTISPECIES: glycosyltransferase family 4 protein [Sorangium]|uniref:Glycosyltransferase n=1 Tax=Sorangium cellulosum TaxID=56 RepID=A0A4P2QIG5_SORCE|nr:MULTISPECIES: glycosyltransferase family 4 protein [Sorangium]AUX29734.1 glycosyltransferase [Sorangium cellulosum]WCQ89123.1 glycosyltransferase [Sorangium sp. Soce836]
MGTSTLRIVHVVSSLNGGGMEHFVLRLAEAQRRHGHDASILALRGGPLADLARQRALPATVLGGRLPARVADAALAFARARPHVIHAHNPTALHYATVGKLLTRARLVFTDHAQTRGIIRIPSRFEWRATDAVVGCSQDTADKSGAVGVAGNISVIHNGIDIAPARRTREEVRAELGFGADPPPAPAASPEPAPSPAESPEPAASPAPAGLSGGAFVGIMPAAFHPVKAHDVLLRALARLRDRGVAVTVLIVGDGDERDRIHGLARELGIHGEEARFLGFRKDVPDLLLAADFFVLPSRDEGLPLAVLEAMARSLPVVVTPVGGVPEVVRSEEHGLLVPVDDPDALAAAIERLARDPALRRRLGEAGHARVRDDFSFEKMTRKYEQLYLGLR